MKKKNYLKFLLAFTAITIGVNACDDNDGDNNETTKETEYTFSRETNYGEDWLYFSFETGKEVDGITEDNYKESLEWDIAFNRYNVRTNSGTSGKGAGGAYDAGKVDFNTITGVEPDSTFVADGTIQIVTNPNTSGMPDMAGSNGSTVFKGCVGYEVGPTGPVYETNNHIYIVRTAKGKYVKLMVTNYYNNKGEAGTITIKYHYQKDGSLMFQ